MEGILTRAGRQHSNVRTNELRSGARTTPQILSYPQARNEERQLAADIIIDRTQYRARIKVMGSPSHLALWIDDGCFDVAVRLTLDTARALAEQLLAQGSPESEVPPSQPRRPVATS
jgi:hypothetical protein